MNNKIPYGRHHVTNDDIKEVLGVLKSDFLTQGPFVKKFELAFAKYIGSKYAVAVSNGTAALHLCTTVLNVSKGDKIITTPITFAATANCIRYCGGEVVFADINSENYLLDINKVRKLIEDSPKGTYKGIIPVDLAGRACDLEAFRDLANKHGLWLIEDSCHSPGGYFIDSKSKTQRCGNSVYADLAIFSFHPVKHIAAGEGGMITTNNKKLYNKLLNLRTHGIQQDSSLKKENHGVWHYEMQELGYNYRLNDIQSALGLSQLKRAGQGIKRRKEIASYYKDFFENKDYILGHSGFIEGHAYHLYIIEVKNRDGLINYLRNKNIVAQVHYIPLHLMPYYKKLGWKKGDFPNAELYYSRALSVPIYPTLSKNELNRVTSEIELFYN